MPCKNLGYGYNVLQLIYLFYSHYEGSEAIVVSSKHRGLAEPVQNGIFHNRINYS